MSALPKYTGVWRACRYASRSKRVPAASSRCTPSSSSRCAFSPMCSTSAGSSAPVTTTGARRALRGDALVEQHLVALQVVHALEAIAGADRPVHRRGRDAEHALDFVQQVQRIPSRQIELVDEGQHRQVPATRHLEELAGLRLDALGRVDHHHDAVGGQQRPVGVLAEVLVARRVEQRDAAAVQLELERRRGDRDAALALDVHPVRHHVPLRRASLHGARQLDRAGVQQRLLGERGLAGVGVGDDREGAALLHFARDGF